MKDKLKKYLLPNLPYLFFVYLFDKLCQAVRLAPGLDASEKLLHIGQGFQTAFASSAPSFHVLDICIGILGAVLVRLAVYVKGKNAKKYRRGIEYGSARWGTAADIAPYIDPVPDWNIPLTRTESLTMTSRPKQPKYARNKNILVIGGSGSGKTRFFVKPSIMQMHSSYVITDPKGQLLTETGKMLLHGAPKLDENGKPVRDGRGKVIYEPYRIKVLNTINFSKSMKYNPLAYVRSEKDILKLVNVIIANTKGDGEKSSEDFWVKAERLLYCALIGYIWYEAEPEERNFVTLLDLLNACEAREDDETYKSPVDILFDDLAKKQPDHFAVKQYVKFKMAAGKTLKSILVSCGARLAPFDIKELRDIMTEDELELDTIILTFVMCYELIQLIVEKNNLHDFDTWLFWKWIFKTFCAVLIVTNTWNIVMAVFDVAQSVVDQSAGVIISDAGIDISGVVGDLETTLEDWSIGSLLGLWFQSVFVGLCYIISGSAFRMLVGDLFDLLAQYGYLRNRVLEAKTERQLARLQKNLSGEHPAIRRMYRRWGISDSTGVTGFDMLESAIRRTHLTPYDPEETAEDGIGCGRCCALCGDHSCEDDYYPFAAFITNLGKYNEGELVGEWVKFPTTAEELKEVFKRIGIGQKDDFGQPYEEWFITDYDCYVDGLYSKLGEYESLDELNYLASKLDEMSESEYAQFQAGMEMGDHCGSLQEIINLTENLDCYEVYPDIHDYDNLGRYYIEELEVMQVPEHLQNYIDYEAYGRDVAIDENGTFTDQGYVRDTGDSFHEYYDGERGSIPDEYRVMAFQDDLPEEEKSEWAMDIAFDMDEFFRQNDPQYAAEHPEAHAAKEELYENLMAGRISALDEKLAALGQTQEDYLPSEIEKFKDATGYEEFLDFDMAEVTAALNDPAKSRVDEMLAAAERAEREYAAEAAAYVQTPADIVAQARAVQEQAAENSFSIYQLKGGNETLDYRFEPLDSIHRNGLSVKPENYELVYTAPLTEKDNLESIYTRFNVDRPAAFTGHSLSVSDIVVLHQNGKDSAHYCDRVGFSEVPEFLQERQPELTPDDLETGERIRTPRGSFYVTAMSREQMEAAGYGVHHISDDGKYLIMGNGTRAFAVAAEQPEKDNPLRTAEMTLEDDYGMIDGVINNGRRGEELEKAQEYAARATPEKPSIRERLADAKRECAEHKPPESKKPGRDVPGHDCL